ncbi:MAG: dCTP deaminase [Candidatus Woesearchaeota archaeon]
MTVLCDKDIRKYLEEGKLVIHGFDISKIDPCSIDLKLGNTFKIFKHNEISHIDIKKGLSEEFMEKVEKRDEQQFIVHPGELILAHTKETVKLPADIVGTLDGRSSLGRIGLVIHSTANSIDPGFEGHITLEISNIAKVPVILYPGMRVCRLAFTKLSDTCEIPYNMRKKSKYASQIGPGVSKISMDGQDKLV